MYMTYIKQSIILVLMLILSSCTGTSYEKFSYLNDPISGYKEEVVSDNLIKVSYLGNHFHSDGLVRRYEMLRIAELGKEKGAAFFAMYASPDKVAKHEKIVEPILFRESNEPTAYAYVQYHASKEKGDLSVKATYEAYNKFRDF